ncbi:hypothetical protein [Campylobacter sp. MG1]|uniref:hypothetical protein n=1 Tax=Campylobacter sp. MG1 TaxID=2976332 RepID=UPI00226CE3CD|nr:hypothetical protein [Campylobacter sp. MG1]
MNNNESVLENSKDGIFSSLIYNKTDILNDYFFNLENILNGLDSSLKSQLDFFAILCDKFPNVDKFKSSKNMLYTQLEQIKTAKDIVELVNNENSDIKDLLIKQDEDIEKLKSTINKISILTQHSINLLECNIENNKG